MSELGIKQSNDMTPWTEASCLFIDAMLSSEFGDKSTGNELANLSKDNDFRFGWFFQSRPILSGSGRQLPSKIQLSVGWLCVFS